MSYFFQRKSNLPLEYDISDFLIFCYNFIGKKGERKKIELPLCPFEKIGFLCPEGVKLMIFFKNVSVSIKSSF